MDKLIAELEAATAGSRELDEKIAPYAGWKRDPRRSDWIDPDNPSHAVSSVPHYSTSLDAKLPRENIQYVSYNPATGNWGATHVNGKTRVWGLGHTEALARRIAALKARGDG